MRSLSLGGLFCIEALLTLEGFVPNALEISSRCMLLEVFTSLGLGCDERTVKRYVHEAQQT